MSQNFNLSEIKAKAEATAYKRKIHNGYRKCLKGDWHERIIFNMIRSNFDNRWTYFTKCRKGGQLERVKGAAWAKVRQHVLNSPYLDVTPRGHIKVKPGVTVLQYLKDMNYA